MIGYVLLGIAVVVGLYLISIYNWFQTASMRIRAAIQDIGNQLKRQASLIPNLENSAKGYLKHEKDVYSLITDARKAVEKAGKGSSMKNIEQASDAISNLVPKLQVVVESNPEMKAEKLISELMSELRDTADKLMYARRVVIDLSADYNTRLVTFPTNLIAGMFGFKEQKGIETPETGDHMSVSEDETKDHKVSL